MNEHNIDLTLLASIEDGDHVVAEYEWDGAKMTVDGPARASKFPANVIYHGSEVLRRLDSAPSATLRRIVSHTPKRPAFKPGDLVRLTGPHYFADDQTIRTFDEAPFGVGSLARLKREGPLAGSWQVLWLGNGKSSTVATSSLSPATLDEPGDPIGSVVYVTGDTAGWRHGLVVGTEVVVAEDNYACDGDYLCRDTKGLTWWIHSADLDIEPPAATVADLDACGTWAVVTGRDGGPWLKRENGTWGGRSAETLVEHFSPLTIRHRGVQS